MNKVTNTVRTPAPLYTIWFEDDKNREQKVDVYFKNLLNSFVQTIDMAPGHRVVMIRDYSA